MTGKQKAALLLMTLDASMASELLKGLDPQTVRELAVELAYLDATGANNNQTRLEVAREFCESLQMQEEFHLNSFLKQMLQGAIGEQQAEQVQQQIQELLRQRDPFLAIRLAEPRAIAAILEEEHPQAAAVVLSELPPKKSSEVIGLLGEGIRLSAVGRMAYCGSVTPEAKRKIAEMVSKRLEALGTTQSQQGPSPLGEEPLRKVAVILRNLGKELRDGLLAAIAQKDRDAGKKVAELMILWEDIPQVADRSLQEALRGIEPKQLALALTKADEAIVKKIRSNISERAAATVDEEASLMSAPKKEEIEKARQEIVKALRNMNEAGSLNFVES